MPPVVVVGHLPRPGLLLHRVVIGRVDPLVGQGDGQAPVQEGHLLEPPRERLEVVVGGLEDVLVGPERDRGPGVLGRLVLGQRRLGNPVGVLLPEDVALAAHLDVQAGGQRVDHRDAHAVQAAGDGVAAAPELAAGVQHGEHDLDAGLALAGDDVHGDAAAVVHDPDPAVGQQRHLDPVAVAGQGLVDRVVHDLVDQVVQATLTGRPDVHARPLAHGVQPLEDCDRTRVIGHLATPDSGGTGERRRGSPARREDARLLDDRVMPEFYPVQGRRRPEIHIGRAQGAGPAGDDPPHMPADRRVVAAILRFRGPGRARDQP